MKSLAVVCSVASLAACPAPQMLGSGTPAWVSETTVFRAAPPARASTVAQAYEDTAQRIVATARADRGAYAKLAFLADRIGHRLSGSPALDQAIAWATDTLQADGHEARTEPVMVPHWVRGLEEAAIVDPVAHPMALLGLGGTVATPGGGVTARVVVVRSWGELEARAADVKGAIVLYDVAMPAYSETRGSGYGEVAQFRTRGASRAAKLGAAAMLVRSITAHSLRTPHTGALTYDPAQPKIPAAAITVEDSQMIARLAAQGPVSVRLRLEPKLLPDAPSANVIGELRGREKPDEIVVIGAHLDSWDVGQGAHDDGAGCAIVMQALTVLRRLGLAPRRTIRVVLFTNEENGLRGAKTYANDHADELAKTVLAVEIDSGGFAPRAFSIEVAKAEVRPHVVARVSEIAALLRPLGAMRVITGHSGADVRPLVPAGVPAIGLFTDGRTYFDYHHTAADTLDKVDPAQLADGVAAMAVLAYVAADLPDRLDAATPAP